MRNEIPQLTVTELKQRMDNGEDLYLLDVREPWEHQIANLGGKLIPMNEVPHRLSEIERDREIIVHCRVGRRSQRVAEFLRRAGYDNVANLSGGIHAWADQVDSSLPKY
ncbi:MAG: rhodanese-like domain-containing protein [Terracidiphilus sp.]